MGKFKQWIVAHKLWSIIIASVLVVGITLAIVLPLTLSHKHNFSKEWSNDASSHWHVCVGENCNEITGKADHEYDNACDTTCNVCEATRTVQPHIYSHACDTTCNVCGGVRTISYYTLGAAPAGCEAYWAGTEMIDGVAGGQYVFKDNKFDSQYPIYLTSDRDNLNWGDNQILLEKYTIRMFDENFNELTLKENSAYIKSIDCYILDKDGNDITENYEGKTVYFMFTLKEAMAFCPVAQG